MERAPFEPEGQVFVCVNRRPPGDPLGEGCGPRGDAVYDAAKAEVGRLRLVRAVAVTRTYCLGQCPRRGTTAVLGPSGATFVEVEPEDVPALVARAARGDAR